MPASAEPAVEAAPPPDVLSFGAAAAALGTNRYSLLAQVARGTIAPVHFAGRLWFRRADVERLAATLGDRK